MLTASGNFYLVNAKGTVVLIDTDIVGDEEFESPHIYQASKKKNMQPLHWVTFRLTRNCTPINILQPDKYRNFLLYNCCVSNIS